jgi:hypothetical protein
MFNIEAPSLQQYLPVDEVINPYVEHNRELFDFYVLN